MESLFAQQAIANILVALRDDTDFQSWVYSLLHVTYF